MPHLSPTLFFEWHVLSRRGTARLRRAAESPSKWLAANSTANRLGISHVSYGMACGDESGAKRGFGINALVAVGMRPPQTERLNAWSQRAPGDGGGASGVLDGGRRGRVLASSLLGEDATRRSLGWRVSPQSPPLRSACPSPSTPATLSQGPVAARALEEAPLGRLHGSPELAHRLAQPPPLSACLPAAAPNCARSAQAATVGGICQCGGRQRRRGRGDSLGAPGGAGWPKAASEAAERAGALGSSGGLWPSQAATSAGSMRPGGALGAGGDAGRRGGRARRPSRSAPERLNLELGTAAALGQSQDGALLGQAAKSLAALLAPFGGKERCGSGETPPPSPFALAESKTKGPAELF